MPLSLFGKRTDVRDAHDKYANQEVAYLLQRIESYNGLVILASNQRANIDDAFVRRLQTIIQFPIPRPEERYEIWRKTFPPQIAISDDIDWRYIATRHELTGAGILNVTHYCAVDILSKQTRYLDLKGLEAARAAPATDEQVNKTTDEVKAICTKQSNDSVSAAKKDADEKAAAAKAAVDKLAVAEPDANKKAAVKDASDKADVAAKEAAMKALGTGHSCGVLWRDVEVVRVGGPPQLRFHGGAAARFARMGATGSLLTLTHSRNLAVAHVMLVRS